MPPSLRDEILRITYGEIIGNIVFFKTMTDGEFLWKILPVLNTIKLEKQEILYWKGDTSDEFYFISKGTLKLYNDQGNAFIKYSNGEMFGDSDALLDLPRDGKAQAITTVVLKSLQIKQFEQLFLNSEDTCLQMIVNARKKRDKHLILMEKANERVRKKTMDHGTLTNLVKSINDEKSFGKSKTPNPLKKMFGRADKTSEDNDGGTPKASIGKFGFGKIVSLGG